MSDKAVIFDMDGVIIDTEKIWKQAEKEIFSSLGVKVSSQHSEQTQTMTTSEVTKYWFRLFPWKNNTLKEVEQRVIARVIELIKVENCSIPGVKPFIQRLKDNNYKLGLATNSPYVIIPVVLEKLNISDLFDTISSAEFELKGKPDPSIYSSTAAKLNIPPSKCFAIEDSKTGMTSARKAGMQVIAFTNGNKEINRKDLADYTIESFKERSYRFLLN